MKALRNLIILISILFSSACNNQDKVSLHVDLLKYGTSFGECLGYCETEMTINGTSILLVRMSRQNDQEDQIYESELSREEYDALLSILSVDDFLDLPETIGCPDCADGGAEFIELHGEGVAHRVTFEFGRPLEGFEELVNELRVIHDGMVPDN